MSTIRFNDKTIRHGSSVWTLSGTISRGRVVLDLSRFYGDVTKPAALRAAVQAMLERPRYRRALEQ